MRRLWRLVILVCAVLWVAHPSMAEEPQAREPGSTQGPSTADDDDATQDAGKKTRDDEGDAEPEKCATKADCKAGQHCSEGGCVAGQCGSEDDCGDAEPYCWDNTCVECRADSECEGLAGFCLSGRCVECVFDADCWCPGAGIGVGGLATCTTFNQCQCFHRDSR